MVAWTFVNAGDDVHDEVSWEAKTLPVELRVG